MTTNNYKISGDFTAEIALEHKEKVNALAHSSDEISLDLTEVTECDIVGINTIASTHKIVSDKGGKLIVKVSDKGELKKLLHLTKFDRIVEII